MCADAYREYLPLPLPGYDCRDDARFCSHLTGAKAQNQNGGEK
jgi:hypothetical protein